MLWLHFLVYCYQNYCTVFFPYFASTLLLLTMLFFLRVFLFSLLFSFVFMARSNEDRVEIIVLFNGESGRNFHETVRRFNALHPERPTTRKYIRDLIEKFTVTFSVKDAKRSGRPKVLNEDQEINLLAEFVTNPQQSIRTVSERHGVPRMSTQRLLKLHKFHPFKIRLIHELNNEDDPDKRLQFCEEMEAMVAADPHLVERICFSDESSFFLNGVVNRYNCRFWSTENPHEGRETHTQYPQKLNVWCGIFGDHIIGPFFINGNLDGPQYLTMLEDAVVPKMIEIIENSPEDFNPWFQQDGAPPHFALPVRAYLDAEFPGRWIGRRGSVE